MSLSLERFWKLAAESQLLSDASSMSLAEKFAQQQGPSASAEMAARWLIDEHRISPYQAKVLLAGRPGPFVYGDYRIHDRIESGRLSGIFRALHTETKHPVCLYFLSGAAAQDPEILQRLAQQAAAAHRAGVGHPHLSRCYHLADEKSYKFIVLQDLQGKRLERRAGHRRGDAAGRGLPRGPAGGLGPGPAARHGHGPRRRAAGQSLAGSRRHVQAAVVSPGARSLVRRRAGRADCRRGQAAGCRRRQITSPPS